MQSLEVSSAVRPLQWSLGVKGFNTGLCRPNARPVLYEGRKVCL